MKEHFQGKTQVSAVWKVSPVADVIIGPSDKLTQDSQRQFLLSVENAMEGSLIRYSKRLQLMDLAEELKINRFQANLLIAQVQQRSGGILPLLPKNQEHSVLPRVKNKDEQNAWRDRIFLAAALFIVCALVDLVLVKFLFGG
ncbi:MAG: hypothetical protein WC975_03555 [Phycisphaerae bacterium]